MKPELDSLAEKFKKYFVRDKEQGGEFLMFIYETFPPKVNCTPPMKEDVVGKPISELEKMFQKAVIRYHPDKVDVDRFGMKAKILNEEITKRLTSFYERARGCS